MLDLIMAAAIAIPAGAQPAVDAAVADAATRFSVQAEVTKIERVTWRDGSLGCPQPGMLSTQALIPGWRMQLATGERKFDYHASEQGRVVYCPPGRAKKPLPDSKT
jgi:hypothetical protein